MEDKNIEKALEKLAKGVKVNQELKRELRGSFVKKKRGFSRFNSRLVAAAGLGILLILSSVMLLKPFGRVSADEVVVKNYRTYTKLGRISNVAVSEYAGILYIPEFSKGIISLDGKSSKKLYHGNVNYVKASPDGKKLAFEEDGAIGLLDLDSQTPSIVLRGIEGSIRYFAPTWYNKNTLLVTKTTLFDGAPFEKNEIMLVDLSTLEEKSITEGSYGSMIPGKSLLVYQKGEMVAVRDLDTQNETILGEGYYPSPSPNGEKIAFTRGQRSEKTIQENVKVEKIIQDVWVVGTGDFNKKTRITSNILLEDIDEEAWLAGIKPGKELQMLSLSGRYCYLYPVWSSDSKSIYTLRRDFTDNHVVLVKADITNKQISAQETADRYLQAVMLLDYDFQSSLSTINADKELFGGKDILAYDIKVQGKEGKRSYVDAEIKLEGNENIKSIRLYLEKQGGYRIVGFKNLIK